MYVMAILAFIFYMYQKIRLKISINTCKANINIKNFKSDQAMLFYYTFSCIHECFTIN